MTPAASERNSNHPIPTGGASLGPLRAYCADAERLLYQDRLEEARAVIKQALRHLRFGEFSVITGYPGFVLWRIGALKLWLKLAVRRLELPPEHFTEPAST